MISRASVKSLISNSKSLNHIAYVICTTANFFCKLKVCKGKNEKQKTQDIFQTWVIYKLSELPYWSLNYPSSLILVL